MIKLEERGKNGRGTHEPDESDLVISFYLFDFLFILRERGREGERERNNNVGEKHRSIASCTSPNQGLNLKPRHVP